MEDSGFASYLSAPICSDEVPESVKSFFAEPPPLANTPARGKPASSPPSPFSYSTLFPKLE